MKILVLIVLLIFPVQTVFSAYKYKKNSEAGIPVAQLTPEYTASARKLMDAGVASYRAGQTEKALPFFAKLVRKYGMSPLAEPAAVLLAQCHLRAENFDEAGWLLKYFPRRYPTSDYQSRCTYLTGILLSQTGDGFGAAGRFLDVYQTGRYPELVRLSVSALRLLIEYGLTPDQLLELSRRMAPSDSLRAEALLSAARLFVLEKDLERSRTALVSYKSAMVGKPLPARAQTFLDSVSSLEKGSIKIGVLVPRTAENTLLNEIGVNILKGVESAAEAFNRTSSSKVELLVRDTRGTAVRAYQLTRDLIDKEGVAALIGPLSTDELCAAAALASSRNVPVISPTASALGDESLGSHVFLLTPTKFNLAKRLVDYTVDSLKINEYAVVFPNDEYGNVMASAFREAVAARGVSLLGYEMYTLGERNFKDILDRIHEKKVEQIFENRALAQGELLGSTEDRRVEVDSSFMADSAVRVGAIFMPGYPEEITMLGPQVPFYKLHTQMLGASGWYYDPGVLKHAGKYIDSAVIAVDFVSPGNTQLWKKFREHYSLLYRGEPDLKAALGYDALNFLLTSGARTSSDILQKLLKKRDYAGVLCNYVFDDRINANRSAVLLRISDESFRRISYDP